MFPSGPMLSLTIVPSGSRMKKTGIPPERPWLKRSLTSSPPMVRSWSILSTIRSLLMISCTASRAR